MPSVNLNQSNFGAAGEADSTAGLQIGGLNVPRPRPAVPADPAWSPDLTGAHLSFLTRRSPESASRRLLLVGTGPLAVSAYRRLQHGRQRVVGFIDSVPQPGWLSMQSDAPLVGGFDDVRQAVLDRCVDEIHVALPVKSCFGWFAFLGSIARELGVPVSFHVDIGEPAVAVQLSQTGAVARCHDHPSMTGVRRLVKRSLDIVVSASALALLSPLFAAIAVAIKLTSRGPVFFRQPRIGHGRRQFDMLKFRTMFENAEQLRPHVQELNNAQGISFKVFQDPRVTRIGRLLRRTSLDELPQLVNVLRGEMSLVGPRPIPTWVAEQMRGASYVRRFSVMQGLTGLWQVEGREQDFDRMALRDISYVDSWSLGLDFRILLRTLPAVLRAEGAH